jgi:hypothetical protein
MRRMHSRAGECADAVALSRDSYRLHAAPDRELVTAAATLAKGLVSVIDGGGLRAQKAAALNLIDNAGRAIGTYADNRSQQRQCERDIAANLIVGKDYIHAWNYLTGCDQSNDF